jgi:hypothetical protein
MQWVMDLLVGAVAALLFYPTVRKLWKDRG